MKKLWIVIVIIVVMQFIRPGKNISGDETQSITTKYNVPEEVKSILVSACNDCHSNKTTYPWYSEIQPGGWWLNSHLKGGKKHLNFSEFTKKSIAVQNHKFEEIIESVDEKEMPLKSYTWLGLHKNAKLSDDQRKLIINWAKEQMDTLSARYPKDSLVMKRNKK